MTVAAACPALARLAQEGVLLSRFENEERLYTGMKDLAGFMLVERGSSQLWHRGRLHEVEPGAVVLTLPGEIYRDVQRDGPASFEIVLFDRAQLEAVTANPCELRAQLESPVLGPGHPRARALRAFHARLPQLGASGARELAVGAAVRALLGANTHESEQCRIERPAIARARAYLRARMLEQVRLDELADHVRLDKYHLIRAFRSELGVPPYEYLTQLRMVRARELLRSGMPSSQVAAELGYYDQSQFHRHFTRLLGTTPGRLASTAVRELSAAAGVGPAAISGKVARSALHAEHA